MTDSIIGSLRVNLGVDASQGEANLSHFQNHLQAFGTWLDGNSIGRALDKVFDTSRLKLLDDGVARLNVFGSAIETLGPVAVGLTAALGGVGLSFEGVRKSMEGIEEIGNLAQSLGIPVAELSDLKYASDETGVSFESLSAGAKRLSANMATVAEGSKGPAASAFSALGVSVKAANGTLADNETVMLAVADKFAAMKDGATKTALAMDIFGKSGADLIPLLNKGSAGLASMFDEARRFGLEISNEAFERAEAFNESVKRMTAASQGAALQIGGALAPTFTTFADVMADAIKDTQLMDGVAGGLAVTFKTLATTAVAAGTGIAVAFHAAVGTAKIGADLLHGDVKDALAANAQAGSAMVLSAHQGADLISRIWSGPTAGEGKTGGSGTPPVLPPTGTQHDGTLNAQKQADQALAEAQKNLDAAIANLTVSIQAHADMEKKVVQDELDKTNGALQAEQNHILADKSISTAKKQQLLGELDIAQAVNAGAAAAKQQKIDQDAEAAVIAQTQQEREKIAGYYDQIASFQEQMATSAAAENKIALSELASRQRNEAQSLKDEQDRAVRQAAGDAVEQARLKSAQAAETAALADKQAAETQVAQRQALARTQAEQNQYAEAGLNLQINLVQSQQGLALSEYARGQLALKLLALQQQLETLKLDEIVNAANVSDAEKEIARAQRAVLPQIHDAQTKALQMSNTLLQGLGEGATALGDFADAFKTGDIGGALSKFGLVLKDASGLLGPNSGFGQALGSIGAELGPYGAIVSGIGEVLGEIFSGSKTIGVVRLSAEDQQKLQGTGTVLAGINEQSASIANSLATAEKYQNQDLDFASQQVAYLKDISLSIGNLTGAIGTALSLGDALSTANLGLGTTQKTSINGWLGVLLGPLAGLTHSTTTTSLTDEGLNLGSGGLQDYLNGTFGGDTYQDLQAVKQSSTLFGLIKTTTTTNSELTQALSGDLTNAVSGVVKSLSQSILQAAGQLGLNGAQSTLNAQSIDIGRISTDGLTSDQITAQLNAVFSRLGDQLAAAVDPGLASLEQAGEGAMQTLERLATEYTTVDDTLASIGMTFKTIGADSINARDNLVQLSGGLDQFTSQASFFQQNFLTDAEQIAPIQAAITKTMAALGEGSVTTKDQFTALVESLDVSTDAGADLYAQLMNIAPAFAKVADYNQQLADAASQAAQQQVSAAQSALQNALQSDESALQGTIQTFTNLAQSLRQTAQGLNISAAATTGQAYAAAKAMEAKLAALASTGDQTAAGQLSDAIQSFLSASKANAPTALDYQRDVAKAKRDALAAADVAQKQADIAQQQLDADNATVEGLSLVNTSVLSVHDAIVNLGSAIIAAASVNGGPSESAQGLGANPEVNAILKQVTGYSGTFGSGGFQAFITSAQASATDRSNAEAVLTAFGQTDRIQGFATGGYGQIGGSSGAVDNLLMQTRISRGEWMSVSHEDPVATTAAAMGDLKTELTTQTRALQVIAVDINTLKRAGTRDGFAVRSQDGSPTLTVKTDA